MSTSEIFNNTNDNTQISYLLFPHEYDTNDILTPQILDKSRSIDQTYDKIIRDIKTAKLKYYENNDMINILGSVLTLLATMNIPNISKMMYHIYFMIYPDTTLTDMKPTVIENMPDCVTMYELINNNKKDDIIDMFMDVLRDCNKNNNIIGNILSILVNSQNMVPLFYNINKTKENYDLLLGHKFIIDNKTLNIDTEIMMKKIAKQTIKNIMTSIMKMAIVTEPCIKGIAEKLMSLDCWMNNKNIHYDIEDIFDEKTMRLKLSDISKQYINEFIKNGKYISNVIDLLQTVFSQFNMFYESVSDILDHEHIIDIVAITICDYSLTHMCMTNFVPSNKLAYGLVAHLNGISINQNILHRIRDDL